MAKRDVGSRLVERQATSNTHFHHLSNAAGTAQPQVRGEHRGQAELPRRWRWQCQHQRADFRRCDTCLGQHALYQRAKDVLLETQGNRTVPW